MHVVVSGNNICSAFVQIALLKDLHFNIPVMGGSVHLTNHQHPQEVSASSTKTAWINQWFRCNSTRDKLVSRETNLGNIDWTNTVGPTGYHQQS